MARPRSVTDDEIHLAAREVFVEHGPNAPVSLIAQRLGVTHAALFGRARTKDQLMLESLRPARPRAVQQLSESPGDDPRRRLVEILTELMAFFDRVVPNLIVLRSAGKSMTRLPPQGEGPPPVILRRLLTRWLERAGAFRRGQARAVAEGLLGAMEARCFNRHLGGGAFAPGTDAVFVRQLVQGLLAVPQ